MFAIANTTDEAATAALMKSRLAEAKMMVITSAKAISAKTKREPRGAASAPALAPTGQGRSAPPRGCGSRAYFYPSF